MHSHWLRIPSSNACIEMLEKAYLPTSVSTKLQVNADSHLHAGTDEGVELNSACLFYASHIPAQVDTVHPDAVVMVVSSYPLLTTKCILFTAQNCGEYPLCL